MKWNTKFLDVTFENKCRIWNYPAELEDEGHIIGKRFNVKKIRVKMFKEFMLVLVKANRQRNDNDADDDNDTTVMEIVA
jgi:hypothetical protein